MSRLVFIFTAACANDNTLLCRIKSLAYTEVHKNFKLIKLCFRYYFFKILIKICD